MVRRFPASSLPDCGFRGPLSGANLLEADEQHNLKPRVAVSSKHDSVRIYNFETYEAAQGCLTELRRRVEDYYTSLRTRRKRA